MKHLPALLTLLLLATLSVSAQEEKVHLRAEVVDELTEYPLTEAKITVADTTGMVLSDSIGYHSWKGYRDSYEEVVFSASLPYHAKYKVSVSVKGYATQLFDVATPSDRYINLGTIMMYRPRRQRSLGEVTVTATRIKMVMKGDTLEYDATAFQLQEGSMLDGLIAALPGATLDNDGRIAVNGRFVSELLINGRKFFSGDPQVALRNLPAYTVKKVQVYQRTPDELRGIKDRDRSNDPLVMDVNLKKEYQNGWIANAEGGYGSGTHSHWTSRWLGRLFAMRYDKYSFLAVHASANNLNDPEAAGNKGEWKKPQATSGEITTKRVGIEYNTDWHDQKYAGINTKINIIRQNTLNTIDNLSEAYLAGGNSFNHSLSSTARDTWKGSWYGETSRYLKTFIYRIWFSAELTYDNGRTRSETTSAESNSMLPASFAKPGTPDFINNILYLRQENSQEKDHTFAQAYRAILTFNKGLSLTAYGKADRTSRHADGSDQIVYSSNDELDINRRRLTDSPSNSYYFSIQPRWGYYSRRWNIVLNYTYKQEYHHGERTIDELNTNPSDSITPPSMATGWAIDYANSYLTTRRSWLNSFYADILYQWGGDNHNKYSVGFIATGNLATRRVDDFRNLTPHYLNRHDRYFDGQLSFNIGDKWMGRGAGIELSLRQNLPDIMEMLDVRDTSNPLVVSLGNPHLRKATTYGAEVSFRTDINQQTIDIAASYSRVADAAARARSFDRLSGVTTWQPMNIDGNWAIHSRFFYSIILLPGKALTISNELIPSFNRNADYSTASDIPERSEVDNWGISNTLNAGYALAQNLTLTGKMSLAWTSLHSRSHIFNTFDFTDLNYGIGLKYTIPGGIELNTDIMAYCRRGYEEPTLNTTDWVWNLQIAKSFGKSKQFTVKAIGFDLLHQLPTVKQIVNPQGRTETRYNSQPAYAIMTLAYRLDIKPRGKTN